jgi:hypothetical protein
MARPRKVFKPDVVEALAACACTFDEIAAYIGWDPATVYRRMENPKNAFAQAFERGRANGRATLRRKQYELALKGNATMQIWLGKQLLGQTDLPQVQMTITNDATATTQNNFTMNENTKKKLFEAAQLVRREALFATHGAGDSNGTNN